MLYDISYKNFDINQLPLDKIGKFLKQNKELLQWNDIKTLYDQLSPGYQPDLVISDLSDFFIFNDIDFLKYTDYIPRECFFRSYIDHITIPSHIQSLDESSFRETLLEEIVIPGNVKIIKHCAFYDCNRLQKVIIEEGVKEIEKNAFNACFALEEVYVPESLTVIHPLAFDVPDVFY